MSATRGAIVAGVACLLVAASASGAQTQATVAASLWYPQWSPDGTHVAWAAVTPNNDPAETSTGTVWVADSAGRKARPLRSFHLPENRFGQISWLTPGSLLVVAGWDERLYRLSLSGRVTRLRQAPSTGSRSTRHAA